MHKGMTIRVKRLFTNQGLLQIFFSLLLVIGVMFIANYYVYKNSISGIYEKVSQNNALVVKSIVQSFDNSFRSINNIIYSIDGLSPYDSLEYTDDGTINMSKVYTMVENLSTFVAPLDYIEETIVSYNDTDLAITSQGTSSFELFFNNKYKHGLYNASYWRSFANTKSSFKVFPAENFRIVSELSQQYRTKKLMVAVGGNKYRMSRKNVMVFIDVNALLKHVNQKTMIPGASLIVLDENRNVILSTDKSLDLIEVLNDVYFDNSQEASVTRGDYEYNFYKSEYNGYLYIDKVPYQFQNIDSVARANYLIMLTAIISAIILAIFLSLYLNNPVKRILRLMGGGHSQGNDFRKIHSGIVKLQMENESQKNQLLFVDSELRKGVFLQALDEYAHSSELKTNMQEYYPEYYRDPFFVLALLQLNQHATEQQLDFEEITARIQRGLQHENIDANVFHVGNLRFLIVIGLNQSSMRVKLLKELHDYVIHTENEELYGFRLRVCVSKLYVSEIENLKRAHRDVMNGVVYRSVNEDSGVMDVENIQYEWNVYFPLEVMEKLSNYLLSGKLTDSIQVIKETMSENAERNIHHHQLVHIAKTMFIYMLRFAGSSANVNNELYELEVDFGLKIEQARDYHDVEKALIRVAKHIANRFKDEQVNKLNPTSISEYMEQHYMSNLYLDHIAEVFETSPKYFSSYFKKTFGINYVEYLNKVRLSHAKKMMKDSTLSLAEIGERSGYLNSSTFTTTFKKYYGISPSEYRKKND